MTRGKNPPRLLRQLCLVWTIMDMKTDSPPVNVLTTVFSELSPDNAKLFAKHGPGWMLARIVAERWPYRSAVAAVSYVVLRLNGF